jgi:hypothetical protein
MLVSMSFFILLLKLVGGAAPHTNLIVVFIYQAPHQVGNINAS